MWKDENGRAPLGVFLGWLLFLTILVELVLLALELCAVAYAEDGKLTLGYAIYAVVGLLFSTPAPLIALYLTLRRAERISLRAFLRRAVHTPHPLRAALVTGLFCAPALAFAICCGTPNGAAWYMLPLGFLVMVPFVGIAEETGWRGFLQPALEKRLPFPVATSVTAAIWYVWHLPLWLHPSSNHYGDSLIGFAMQIFVWAFAAFHALFFPGKDNWLFDPATDPVIGILPETFFLRCAVLILALLLLGCAVLLVTGRRRKSFG